MILKVAGMHVRIDRPEGSHIEHGRIELYIGVEIFRISLSLWNDQIGEDRRWLIKYWICLILLVICILRKLVRERWLFMP